MTKKIKDMARIAYFGTETHNRYGLEGFADGFEKGFQMALLEVKLLLDKCNNNLDRLNAIKELVKEVQP